MKINRKNVLITGVMLITVTLSGCSSVEGYLEEKITEKSEIYHDADYKQYAQLNKDGKLNSSAEFTATDIFDTSEAESAAQKQVHVTFADNRYLKISYFTDEKLTEVIDPLDCYLDPGDRIFASVESVNKNSNLYRLAGYRIHEYDTETNERSELARVDADQNNKQVYQIAVDYTGTELSVVPVGEYFDRKLIMTSYYLDNQGHKNTLSNPGDWYVNEESCVENTVDISPIDPYIVKFDFDQENYFYVDSQPKSFNKDPNEDGKVEFWEVNPAEENGPIDEDVEYTVQLHPYLSLELKFDEKGSIRINDGVTDTIKSGKTWAYDRLKYGDKIVVETAGSPSVVNGSYEHLKVTEDPIETGFRYTMTITQEKTTSATEILEVNENLSLILSSDAEYGEVTYKLDGDKVTGTIRLQENQKLTLTYTITNKEYVFSDGNLWNEAQGFFGNMEKSVQIPVTSDMNGDTIVPDDWFSIKKKGE